MIKQDSAINFNEDIRKYQAIDEYGKTKERSNIVVKKEKTKEGFLKIFIDNIRYLVDLDNIEKSLFFIVLSRMDYKNVIYMDRTLRQGIVGEKFMSRSTYYKALKGLVDKEIILKIDSKGLNSKDLLLFLSDEAYLVNPSIIGKGSFRDLKKLRHTLVTDYDFEKFEFKAEIIKEAQYDSLEEN